MTTHSKRLREEAARWFARMQNAAADHPDRGRFEAWLMTSPAHASEYCAFAETWDDFDSTSRLQSLAHALDLKKSEQGKQVKTVVRGVLGIFLAITCSLFGYHTWISQPVYELASSTGIGEIKHQQLADGTVLTLNANTKAEIAYYRDKRVAVLNKGEVIFDVAHDPERPFIVDSGHAQITVLGTYFAVNRLNQLVRISVDHGRVSVEAHHPDGNLRFEPLILSDGEVAEVEAGNRPVKVNRNAQDAFGFQKGALNFHEASMEEIAETLSRYHKPAIKSLVSGKTAHVSAVVQIADIESFLLILPRIAPVNVQELNGEITLTSRRD
jgi:transmembrane sensor